MRAVERPEFRSLTRDEIYGVLARNHVGRMAYSQGAKIHIEPLHYVYSGGWLYGRTSRGSKLDGNDEGRWPIAFEVDEIDGLFEWRSVVVHGGFYTLSANGGEWERKERAGAIEVLRRLVPEAFTPNDPTPFRDIIFRIAVQEVTGRAASTGSQAVSVRAPVAVGD